MKLVLSLEEKKQSRKYEKLQIKAKKTLKNTGITTYHVGRWRRQPHPPKNNSPQIILMQKNDFANIMHIEF